MRDLVYIFPNEDFALRICGDWKIQARNAPREHNLLVGERSWNESISYRPKICFEPPSIPGVEGPWVPTFKMDEFVLFVSTSLVTQQLRDAPHLVAVANPQIAEKSPGFYEYCVEGCEWILPHLSPVLAGRMYGTWKPTYVPEPFLIQREVQLSGEDGRIEKIEAALAELKNRIDSWELSNDPNKKKMFLELSFYLEMVQARTILDSHFCYEMIRAIANIGWNKAWGLFIGATLDEQLLGLTEEALKALRALATGTDLS